MNNIRRLIIVLIILVLIVLLGIAMFATSNTDSYKTMTFSDTRTSMEVPQTMALKTNQQEDGMKLETYATDDGNIQIERRLVNDTQMEVDLNITATAQTSRTLSNNTTGETFLIESFNGDNETVDHIAESIKWGKKVNFTTEKVNVTANASANNTNSSQSGDSQKTYPFYGDTGDLIGYYHVGDTVSFKDYIFQLQSNGEWVMVGEAQGTDQQASDSGYDSDSEDANSNGYSQSESSSESAQTSSSSSSSNVETTVDNK